MSWHAYLYAHCDAANRIDPTGLFTLPEVSVITAIQGILRQRSLLTAWSTLRKTKQLVEIVDAGKFAWDLFSQGRALLDATKRHADIEFKPLLKFDRGLLHVNLTLKFKALGSASAGFREVEIEFDDKRRHKNFKLSLDFTTGNWWDPHSFSVSGTKRLPGDKDPVPLANGSIGLGLYLDLEPTISTTGFSLKLQPVLEAELCNFCTTSFKRRLKTSKEFDLWSLNIPDDLQTLWDVFR